MNERINLFVRVLCSDETAQCEHSVMTLKLKLLNGIKLFFLLFISALIDVKWTQPDCKRHVCKQ